MSASGRKFAHRRDGAGVDGRDVDRDSRGSYRWRVFLDVDLDICVWDTDLDHWMRRSVSTIYFVEFVLAIRLASFAKVEIGTNGTFVANATDAPFGTGAGNAVAMDITMLNLSNSHGLSLSRKMIVDRSKLVARVNFVCFLDAFVAKVIIATLEAFVPDTNNIL